MDISPEILGCLGIIAVMLLLAFGMWIGGAMGLVGLLGFSYLSGGPATLKLIATVPYNTLSDYTFAMIPLFILMGVITANTGIAGDLYRAANAWIGHVPGGLAMGTTLSCALFGAVCGASLAEIIAIGKLAVPEMKKLNYSTELATGSVAAAGVLIVLIPPSLAFVIYGILTECSIGKLFLAGILPGVLIAILFLIVILVIAKINPSAAPASAKTTWREKSSSLRGIWAILFLFLLVIGGIYGGIFTATEAGAIGAFGAIVISIIGRKLTKKNLLDSLYDTVRNVGMFAFLLIGAYLLTKFMAISNLPFALSGFIADLEVNRYLVLAVVIFFYIIMGMFFDVMAAIILTIPILLPTITGLGFDPIWFGVIMVILMEMAGITPPIGFAVFVLSGVTGVPVGTIFRGSWPFVLAEFICIIILVVFPQIALFIPGTM